MPPALTQPDTLNEEVAIDSASLEQPQDELKIPQAPQPRDFSGSIQGSIDSLLNNFQQEVPQERTQQSLQQQILGSLGKLGTETGRREELRQEAGLPQQQKDLQNVINQLNTLSKERQAIPLQLQEESMGRGRTAGGVEPIETSRLRKNAIEALSLSAIGQTLQGNIALAEQNIDRAIEAEFEPERTRLEVLQQAYLFNREALERVDKKRAQELEVRLAERERVLNQAEAEKKATLQIMTEAAQFGAPATVLEKMRNATPEEAVALGTKYLGAEFKQQAEQIAFDNNIRTRQIALQESEFAFRKRESLLARAEAGDPSAIDELGYDPNDLPLSNEELLTYEEQKISIEKDIADIKAALENDVGFRSSTGTIKGKLAVAGTALAVAGSGAALGSLAGPAGTAAGGVAGLTTGIVAVNNKRNDFMSTARYVVNNLTFKKVGELADQGIKLNPISENEIKLMGQSSERLAAMGDYDEGGNLLGFNGSPDEVRREMEAVLDHYERALAEINMETMLRDDDLEDIDNL